VGTRGSTGRRNGEGGRPLSQCHSNLGRRHSGRRRRLRAGFQTVADEYRDEGVGGTRELGDRPSLAALLDRAGSNGVRVVVVVEHADRLARDVMVSEVIIDQFAGVGTRVLTTDGADLTSADGARTRTLTRQVL